MKHIDFNQLSELGLLCRINATILHPLGLAISRNPETGFSEKIFVADDGAFQYAEGHSNDKLSESEIRVNIKKMLGD